MLPGPTRGARLPAQYHSGCPLQLPISSLISKPERGIDSRSGSHRRRKPSQHVTQSAALSRRSGRWGSIDCPDKKYASSGSLCCSSPASASADYFLEEDGAPSSSAQSAASSEAAQTVDTGEVCLRMGQYQRGLSAV